MLATLSSVCTLFRSNPSNPLSLEPLCIFRKLDNSQDVSGSSHSHNRRAFQSIGALIQQVARLAPVASRYWCGKGAVRYRCGFNLGSPAPENESLLGGCGWYSSYTS